MQTKQLEMYIINKQLFTHPLHATGFFKAIFKRFGNAIGFAGLSCVCGLVTFINKHIFFLGKNKFDKRGLCVMLFSNREHATINPFTIKR